VQTRGG